MYSCTWSIRLESAIRIPDVSCDLFRRKKILVIEVLINGFSHHYHLGSPLSFLEASGVIF